MVRHLKLYAGSDLAEASLAGGRHSHCIGQKTQEIGRHESNCLATSNVLLGARIDGLVLRFHYGVRENLRGAIMIYLTGAVALFLFVYLSAALMRPEWF
jgi:K+-transporting ATPase KdpF subunit